MNQKIGFEAVGEEKVTTEALEHEDLSENQYKLMWPSAQFVQEEPRNLRK